MFKSHSGRAVAVCGLHSARRQDDGQKRFSDSHGQVQQMEERGIHRLMYVMHLWSKDKTKIRIRKTPSGNVMLKLNDRNAEMTLVFQDEEAFKDLIADVLKGFWETEEGKE